MWQKFKSFLEHDTYFMTALLLLVGAGSFGLGRWSVVPVALTNTTTAVISPLAPLTPQTPLKEGLETPVVASISGTKYHLLECPGAKQMKETNKIQFVSREAAEAAGYTPAANCPGLRQ